MQALTRYFVRPMDRLSEWLGWLSVITVLLAVIIGIYNVAARYIGRFVGMQLSSNIFIELQWYLYSLVFLFGFAYILKHGINVRVDFIYANWPKKRKAALDFWGHIFFLIPFCILGIWVTVNPVLTSWGRLPNGSWCFAGEGVSPLLYFLDIFNIFGNYCGEGSPDPNGLNRAPLKSMIIFAFAFLLLQGIAELIKLFAVLTGRDEGLLVEELGEHEEPIRIE